MLVEPVGASLRRVPPNPSAHRFVLIVVLVTADSKNQNATRAAGTPLKIEEVRARAGNSTVGGTKASKSRTHAKHAMYNNLKLVRGAPWINGTHT